MAKSGGEKKFSDQIRDAINDANISRYAMSKVTGIHESALSRFMHRRGGLSLDNLDALADLLGWDLAVRKAADTASRSKKG